MAGCGYVKPSGERCGAPAMTDSLLCYMHNPDVAEERQRNLSKAGRTGGRGRPKSGGQLSAIKAQLQELTDGVLAGDVDRADGAVCAQLLNTLLRAVELERRIKETAELEARLDELELSTSLRGSGWAG
jgi:hypothetical protein